MLKIKHLFVVKMLQFNISKTRFNKSIKNVVLKYD